jgi:hypothetical protein
VALRKKISQGLLWVFSSDWVVLPILSLNMVALGALAAAEPTSLHWSSWTAASWVDWFCSLFFVIEIPLRFWRQFSSRFPEESRSSGILLAIDGVVFVPSVLVVAEIFAPDLGFLSEISALRAFRLFKMIPLLTKGLTSVRPDRFLRSMKAGLGGSVAVLFAGILLTYLFGLIGTYSFARVDPENFGNMADSMVSVLQIMTFEGWGDMSDTLEMGFDTFAEKLLVKAFFVMIVVVLGIVGMAVATATLVEVMQDDDNYEQSELLQEVRAELRAVRAELQEQRGEENPAAEPGDGLAAPGRRD